MLFCIKGALVMPAGYPGLLLCIPFTGFLGGSCLLESLLPEVFFSYTFHIPIIWVLENKSRCFGGKNKFWNKHILNLNRVDNEKYYFVLSYFHSLIVSQKETLMVVLVLDLPSEDFSLLWNMYLFFSFDCHRPLVLSSKIFCIMSWNGIDLCFCHNSA